MEGMADGKPFKMKGHTLPGINQRSEGNTDLPDGRSASSAFQYRSPAKTHTPYHKDEGPPEKRVKKQPERPPKPPPPSAKPIYTKKRPVDPNINPKTGLYYPKPGGAEGNKPKPAGGEDPKKRKRNNI